jgi:formate dehydrogenase subunit gamma
MPTDTGDLILRHPVGERLTHWAIALAFIVLFLSGLAMFHPFFYWLSFLFASGQFMRAVHPVAGVALVVLFYPYAARVWHDNRWLPADTEWVRHMTAFMGKSYHGTGTGKYNGGQKLMFWSMVPIIALLFVTGAVVWQPWIAPWFSAPERRTAGMLHAIGAFVMFVGIGIHWYAAYWTRGSVQAMVRGTVTRRWAKFHHPAWYREMTGGRP